MMFEHYEKMNKLHANWNQTISSSYFVKNFVEFDTITFLIKKEFEKLFNTWFIGGGKHNIHACTYNFDKKYLYRKLENIHVLEL